MRGYQHNTCELPVPRTDSPFRECAYLLSTLLFTFPGISIVVNHLQAFVALKSLPTSVSGKRGELSKSPASFLLNSEPRFKTWEKYGLNFKGLKELAHNDFFFPS